MIFHHQFNQLQGHISPLVLPGASLKFVYYDFNVYSLIKSGKKSEFKWVWQIKPFFTYYSGARNQHSGYYCACRCVSGLVVSCNVAGFNCQYVLREKYQRHCTILPLPFAPLPTGKVSYSQYCCATCLFVSCKIDSYLGFSPHPSH